VKITYSAVTVIPSSRGTRNCIFIVTKSDSQHPTSYASCCCHSRNFSPEYWQKLQEYQDILQHFEAIE